ncbi:DUF6701 domain-containing protein [Pseudomonas borbori]
MGLNGGRRYRRFINCARTMMLLLVCLLIAPSVFAATYAFQSTSYAWESANTDVVWDQTQTAYPRDDDKQLINIGFTFNFAGANYTQVRIHANGALQFGADTQFHRQFTNTDLPVDTAPPSCTGCTSGSAADRLMLVYWDDINPRLGGTVRYQTKGTAPNRRLVVSWEAVPHYNFGGSYSFQVILYEQGEFVYQYGTGNASGVSATIGTEVNDSDYTQYSFDTSYSYAGTAIRWFRPSGEPNRLAEYRFEERVLNGTVNEVIDWSGNDYYGQAVGSAASEADGYTCRGVRIPRNTSNSISAINTNLDVDATIGNSGAISFWYRADNAWNTRDHQLLDASTQNNRWFFLVKRQTRALRFVMSDSAGANAIAETAAQNVSANTWKHIAVTWRFAAGTNQTVLRIYVDGTLSVVTQTTTNGSLASSLGTLFIGDNRSNVSGQSGTLNSAEGTFDSVRVYNYEISNADVGLDMQATHPCQVFNHIRILHDGEGLTCSPESVSLQACADSLCTNVYTGSVSTTLQVGGVAVGTTSFTGGTGSLAFNRRTAGAVALSVANTSPQTVGAFRCRTGEGSTSCDINFVDSGFVFDVPNTLAAKPVAATLRAVKKDDSTQACVPGFVGDRNVGFTTSYISPTLAASAAAGVTVNQPVVVNGIPVSHSATASLTLTFDENGSAPLTVRYDDAGSVRLNASYAGTAVNNDIGLGMTGSGEFKSRPYGLCLQTGSTCTQAGVNGNCSIFARAGDNFPLRISAVGWQRDGEPLTAAELCAVNIVTPKFEMAGIGLASALIEPQDGVPGAASPLSYNHVLGAQTTVNLSLSEVGVFRLTATPPTTALGRYLGTEIVDGGNSAFIGRIAPAYLGAAGSGSLTPSCGSAFSYQGQPMSFATPHQPTLTVTGFNRQGAVTRNYDRGDFWRLDTPTVGVYSSITGTAVDTRLTTSGTASVASLGENNGDGARTYRWSGQQLVYGVPTNAASAADLPFMAKVRHTFSSTALTDKDGTCQGTACSDFSYDFIDSPGSEVRLGRLRIGNAHGSELQALSLPLTIESWQASGVSNGFAREGLDNCTATFLAAPSLTGFSGNLASGETTANLNGPTAGVGFIGLTAPGTGNDGSVRASFSPVLPPTWLYYDWNGTGREMASGLATFGIYRGATPLIFRRELYR